MTNQHPITWVVVADKCQANIYRLLKFPKLEECTRLEHPESRLHNQDLISSKPGHSVQQGKVTGYSYQPEHDPKELEGIKFAISLAKYLAIALQKGQFNRLYLFADPAFLGMLRPHMNPDTQKTIIVEVAKELTSHGITDIEHQLAAL